ncbi:MAG: prepilin-type N-terminal cleavage/methylation domain-containing protein [Phycisphaerales bacterium]|nr:prepilin-type N-terminal cleavage/methylation domain-containing protein [Phycisphaerales bacterium]
MIPPWRTTGMGRGGRTRRALARGLTLIELMVVIALLVALAALVVPTFLRPSEESMRAAVEQTGAAVTLARADAMRRGVPVELRARMVEGVVELSMVARIRSSRDSTEREPDRGFESDGLPQEQVEPLADDPQDAEDVLLDLPSGVRIERADGQNRAEQHIDAGEDEGDEPDGRSAAAGLHGGFDSHILAILLPDGQLLGEASWVLVRGEGAARLRMRITVSSWSGNVQAEALSIDAEEGDAAGSDDSLPGGDATAERGTDSWPELSPAIDEGAPR